jgi:hypothetical protein
MDSYANGGIGYDANRGIMCSSDELLCMVGANSPLCGSCDDGFIFSSAERICVPCGISNERAFTVFGACAAVTLFGLVLHIWVRRIGKLPAFIEKSWVWGVLKQIDDGALRVAWSNYQVSQLSFM